VTEEERRAAVLRQQCANRARWRQRQAERFAGDPAAAASVRTAFAPLLPDPIDAWDCPPPQEAVPGPWLGHVPGDVELPEYLKRRAS
jgi:hypothetical protein